MKTGCKILLLLLFVLSILFAWGDTVSFNGTSINGANVLTPAEIQNGVWGWWLADRGVSLAGTNVWAWADQSGNNNNLHMFLNNTNMPIYGVSGFNIAKNAVQLRGFNYLSADSTANGTAPGLVSNQFFTFIMVAASGTNISASIISFGNKATAGATNSIIIRAFNNNTNFQVAVTSADGNAQTFSRTIASNGLSISNFAVEAFQLTGSNGVMWTGLSNNTGVITLTGGITNNTFTLGAHTRLTTVSPCMFTDVFEIQVYTNTFSGATMTNLIRGVGARWGISTP